MIVLVLVWVDEGVDGSLCGRELYVCENGV